MFFSLYINCLTIVDLFEVLVGRDIFSAITPVQGPYKTERLCHPLPLFMAAGTLPNMWHSSCFRMRCLWLTTFGVYARFNSCICFLYMHKNARPGRMHRNWVLSYFADDSCRRREQFRRSLMNTPGRETFYLVWIEYKIASWKVHLLALINLVVITLHGWLLIVFFIIKLPTTWYLVLGTNVQHDVWHRLSEYGRT